MPCLHAMSSCLLLYVHVSISMSPCPCLGLQCATELHAQLFHCSLSYGTNLELFKPYCINTPLVALPNCHTESLPHWTTAPWIQSIIKQLPHWYILLSHCPNASLPHSLPIPLSHCITSHCLIDPLPNSSKHLLSNCQNSWLPLPNFYTDSLVWNSLLHWPTALLTNFPSDELSPISLPHCLVYAKTSPVNTVLLINAFFK